MHITHLSDLARSYSSSLFARSCSLLRPSLTLICCARVMALDSKAHFEQRPTEPELRLAALCRKRLDHCWSFRFLDYFRSGQCGRCRVQAPTARAACYACTGGGSTSAIDTKAFLRVLYDGGRGFEKESGSQWRRIPSAASNCRAGGASGKSANSPPRPCARGRLGMQQRAHR
jgi:hypothetical protein